MNLNSVGTPFLSPFTKMTAFPVMPARRACSVYVGSTLDFNFGGIVASGDATCAEQTDRPNRIAKAQRFRTTSILLFANISLQSPPGCATVLLPAPGDWPFSPTVTQTLVCPCVTGFSLSHNCLELRSCFRAVP